VVYAFFFSILVLLYIYVGYPLIVLIISFLSNKRVSKNPFEPKITIIIAAHNEEAHIHETIKNKLNLEYPSDKLEIICVSDGSTDGTDELIKQFVASGVTLIRQDPRSGKTAALNRAVPIAKGDIIVFSDANSLYAPDALLRLAENFSDPHVGYVTGKMVYANPDHSIVGDGCTFYMKYENLMRKYETSLGSIVGVDGGIDAVRKNLYRPMKPDQLPDLVLPLMVVEQGYRVVYEPLAVLIEHALNSQDDEYRMRVRVSLRALWALYDLRHLFDIRRFHLFSWQLFSHKLLRYLAFFFMLVSYLANIFLWYRSIFFRSFFIIQSILYACALLGHILIYMRKKIGYLYIPYYFSLINIAAGNAFIKFCLGEKKVTWTPRKG